MKKAILYFNVIILVFFNACKKEQVDPQTDNIINFSNEGCIHKEGEMLVFSDWATFMTTMEELEKLENEFNQNYSNDVVSKTNNNVTNNEHDKGGGNGNTDVIDSLDFGSPVLTAFEKQYNHNSLRLDIIQRENKALADGTWSETNDPDNHFIADPYMRTILNTSLEVKIGNEYVKYIDQYKYVRIIDGDINVLNKIRNNPSLLCSRTAIKDYKNIAIIETRKDPNCELFNLAGGGGCNASFKSDIIDEFNNVYKFYPTEFDESYEYEWVIDGSIIGNDAELSYAFPSYGDYTVCLTITNCPTSNSFLSTSCQKITATDPCSITPTIYFTQDSNDPLKVTFSSNYNSFSNVNYEWYFGDGSTSTASSPTHSYYSGGYYPVTLKVKRIECNNDNTVLKNLTVARPFEVGPCCDASDRVKEKYYYFSHNNNLYAMKCKVWFFSLLPNFFGNSSVYTKVGYSNALYKKNSKGKWKSKKADRLYASAGGGIYVKDDDGVRCAVKIPFNWGIEKTKKSSCSESQGFGKSGWLKHKSVQGYYFVTLDTKSYVYSSDLSNFNLYLSTDVELCSE